MLWAIANSNMTFFIGKINKCRDKTHDIFEFEVISCVHTGPWYIQAYCFFAYYFFPEKILNTFRNLQSSGDIVYKECW